MSSAKASLVSVIGLCIAWAVSGILDATTQGRQAAGQCPHVMDPVLPPPARPVRLRR